MTFDVVKPFFLELQSGAAFALYRSPANAKGCVLLAPPFAEEMNKSRRQFTEVSEALAKTGYATLSVDLRGTGDSADEFSNATWAGWREDLAAAILWAQANTPQIHSVIAVRLGCVLVAETLAQLGLSVEKTVFWQPVVSGKQSMTQFLRLRVAASMMDGAGKETIKDLRGRLNGGDLVEVAGYHLSSQLVSSIDQLDLASALSSNLGRLKIVEVAVMEQSSISPMVQKLVQAATDLGLSAEGLRLVGEPFWSATEIVTNSALTQATIDFIESDE